MGSGPPSLGLGRASRRTVKPVGDGNALTEEMGDWEATCRYYYDGWRRVEVRDGSSRTLRQTVFGLMYVDEICQVAINQDPQNVTSGTTTENLCERFFYVLQNANFNVQAVTDTNGNLIERYEYTPYGERTLFTRNWALEDMNDDGQAGMEDLNLLLLRNGDATCPASRADLNGDGAVGSGDINLLLCAYDNSLPWSADPKAMRPVQESARGVSLTDAGDRQLLTVGLCDFGHQGLPHDREFNHAVENRRRTYWPHLMHFGQIDPGAESALTAPGNSITGSMAASNQYADGMDLYQYVESRPTIYVDPLGLWKWKKRGGNARAVILSEPGDTTASAAEFARLEPSEVEKWLKNEKTGKWVSPGDTVDTPNCPYSVPNTVYVTKGDVSGMSWKKDWVSAANLFTSWTISGYIKEMKRRGYRVVYDNSATASDVSGYLSKEDAYGWFFAGHGGDGVLFCAKAGGPEFEDIMIPRIASGALHHKLGFVTLYACEAGKDADWLTTGSMVH